MRYTAQGRVCTMCGLVRNICETVNSYSLHTTEIYTLLAAYTHLQKRAELAGCLLILFVSLIKPTCILQDLLLLLCNLTLAVS